MVWGVPGLKSAEPIKKSEGFLISWGPMLSARPGSRSSSVGTYTLQPFNLILAESNKRF